MLEKNATPSILITWTQGSDGATHVKVAKPMEIPPAAIAVILLDVSKMILTGAITFDEPRVVVPGMMPPPGVSGLG